MKNFNNKKRKRMKDLKKYDAAEMSIKEQRVIDGGVAPDENGKGCTEHGFPYDFWDFLKNGGSTGPYNPYPNDFDF